MIQDAIETLKRKIVIESSNSMTDEQKHYVVGLADALQIIENEVNNGYSIGKKYYCIMFKDKEQNIPYIDEMYLYRINKKKIYAYCFARNINNPTPDLVLYSNGVFPQGYSARLKMQQNS